MHYLIVEDDQAIRHILKEVFELLESDGKFTFCKDGNEAFAWLDKVDGKEIQDFPDIAFIDIRMPGPQGYEVAERIRKTPPIANIGIVLMTAYELEEKKFNEIMTRSKADRYIPKPLPGVKGLNQMVEEIMALKRSENQEANAGSDSDNEKAPPDSNKESDAGKAPDSNTDNN